MIESLKHLVKVYFRYLRNKNLYKPDLRKAKNEFKTKYYNWTLENIKI